MQEKIEVPPAHVVEDPQAPPAHVEEDPQAPPAHVEEGPQAPPAHVEEEPQVATTDVENPEAPRNEDATKQVLEATAQGTFYADYYGAAAMAIFAAFALGAIIFVLGWRKMWSYLTSIGKLFAIGVATLMGIAACTLPVDAISPHRRWEAEYPGEVKPYPLRVSFNKSMLIAPRLLVVVPSYADVTDIRALNLFWTAKHEKSYFCTNALGIAGGALLGAALLLNERQYRFEAYLLAAASTLQLVPAGCFAVALYLFCATSRQKDFKRSPLLYKYGIPGFLTSTSLVEGLVEGLMSSEV